MKDTINDEELSIAAAALQCQKADVKAQAPARLYVCHPNSEVFEYTGHFGVATINLDMTQALLSINFVDLKSKQVIIKQEVYDPFVYHATLDPHFHCFEADDFLVGLSFSENYEAKSFAITLQGLQNIVKSIPKAGATSPAVKSAPKAAPTPAPQEEKKGFFSSIFGKKTEKKPVQARPTIGKPKNFQHVSHLGFDPKTGFSEIPEQWKQIFTKAGISEEELRDKKTAKFLVKTMVHENNKKNPPPPPAALVNASNASVATTTPSVGSGAPPPPPPPPLVNAPKPPPPPKAVTTPTGVPEPTGGVGSSSDLLSQIRMGTKLKKVNVEQLPDVDTMNEAESDTLAGKIAEAMRQRREAVEESESDSDDDWEL
ncbi:hypothetical protein AKO1_012121 [Acrasis kona]|uniref:Non-specific serine/threonine protein kinase n=1 Tax=Acrasis kona TaxID=1008807 RepID=A0AAW2ZDT1_9EUKA